MNTFNLIGRVTYIDQKEKFISIGIAYNYGDKTDFFKINYFKSNQNITDYISNYVGVGDKVLVCGYMTQYTINTTDGDINTIGLVGSTLEMLAKKYEPNTKTENQPSQNQNNTKKQYQKYAKS